MSTISETPNLTAELLRRGWSEQRIFKVMGGNWLRFLNGVIDK